MKNSFRNLVFVSSLFCLFFYVCSIGIKNIYRYNVFLNEYKTLQKDYHLVQKRNQLLKQQLVQIEDMDYLEEEIKKKLGYIHEGEVVYYFTKKGYK